MKMKNASHLLESRRIKISKKFSNRGREPAKAVICFKLYIVGRKLRGA
jgi:hypothetical protein